MRTRSGLLICAVLSVAVAVNVLFAQTAWMSDTPTSQQALGVAAEGVACSRDGAYIGIATVRGLILKRGDQTVIDQPVGHLYSVDISPDGRFVAGGGRDGTIRVWDVDSREVVKTLRGHRATVSSVRFSPDGRRMASGSWDGSVILWDTETWTSVRTLPGHTDEVYAVAFSPDGAHVASGGWDRTVRVWTGETVKTLTLDAGVMTMAFSPDGKHLTAGAYDGAVGVWSTGPSWAKETVSKDAQSPVRSIIFSPDGYLVSGHEDGGLRVLNVSAGRTVMVVPSRGAAVMGLSLDSTKRILISVARDGQFAFWITSPPPPPPPTPPTIQITSPAQSPYTTQDASIVVAGIVTDDSGVKDIRVNDVSLFGTGERGVIVVPRETGRSIQFERTFPLQPGENRITVAAQDDAGARTVREILVTYQPPPPSSTVVQPSPPPTTEKTYAVVIAIQGYADPNIRKLQYTEADATDIYNLLTDPERGGIPKENVKLLLGSQAKRDSIRDAIGNWLFKNAGSEDKVILFYAGHGAVDIDKTGQERDGLAKYILPYDAKIDNLFVTGLSNADISQLLRAVKSGKMVFFLDSCYSGGATRSVRGMASASVMTVRAENIDKDAYRALAGSGRAVIAASQPNQVSLELPPPVSHGVFTYYLLDALRGSADADKDGYIDLDEAFRYVSRMVPERARREGSNQDPLLDAQGLTGKFVLAQHPERLTEIQQEKEAVRKRQEEEAAKKHREEELRRNIQKITDVFNAGHISAEQFERAIRILRAGESNQVLEAFLRGAISVETFKVTF